MKSKTNAIVKASLKNYKIDKTLIDLLSKKISHTDVTTLKINNEELKKTVDDKENSIFIYESNSFTVKINYYNSKKDDGLKNNAPLTKIEFLSKLEEKEENLGKAKKIEIQYNNCVKVDYFNKVVSKNSVEYYPFLLSIKNDNFGRVTFFSNNFSDLIGDRNDHDRKNNSTQEENTINYKLETLEKIANFNLIKFIENKFVLNDSMLSITEINKQNINDLKMDFYKSYKNFEDYTNNFCLYNKESAIHSYNQIKEISEHIKNNIVNNINKNIMNLEIFDNMIFDNNTKVSLSLERRNNPILYIERLNEKFIVEIDEDVYNIKANGMKSFQINMEKGEIVISEGQLKVFLEKTPNNIEIKNIILNNHNFISSTTSIKEKKEDFETYINSIKSVGLNPVEKYLKILDHIIVLNNLNFLYLLDNNFILDDIQKDLIMLSIDYNLNENENFKILEKNFITEVNKKNNNDIKNIFSKKF